MGQDFLFLKRWLKSHPDVSQPGLLWEHPPILDPEILALDYRGVPSGPDADRSYNRKQMMDLGPQPGWYVMNVWGFSVGQKQFAYFFRFEPAAVTGYSIFIYHITLEDANRVRRELGLPELARESRDNGG